MSINTEGLVQTAFSKGDGRQWKGILFTVIDPHLSAELEKLGEFLAAQGVISRVLLRDRRPQNEHIKLVVELLSDPQFMRVLTKNPATLKQTFTEDFGPGLFVRGVKTVGKGSPVAAVFHPLFGDVLEYLFGYSVNELNPYTKSYFWKGTYSETGMLMDALREMPDALSDLVRKARKEAGNGDFTSTNMLKRTPNGYESAHSIYTMATIKAIQKFLREWQETRPLEGLYLPEDTGGSIPTKASGNGSAASGSGHKRKKGNGTKKTDAQLPPITWEDIQVNPEDWLRTVDNPTPDSVCLLDGSIPARGKGLLPFDDPFAQRPKAPRLGKRPVHDLDHLPFLAAQILRVHPYVFEYYQRCASPARWACGEVDKGVRPPPKELAARGHTKEDYASRKDNFHFTFFDATLAEKEDAVTVLRAVEVHRIARVYRDAEHRDQARNRENPYGKPVFYCVHPSWEANIRDQWELGKRHMEQGRHIDNAAISRYLAARKREAAENADS